MARYKTELHCPAGMALSGITTETEIKSKEDLLSALKSGQYGLITY